MHNNKSYYKPFAFCLYFFVSFCGNLLAASYLPLYFSSIGFSDSRIGILLAIPPAIGIFTPLFWGTLADRSKNKCTALVLVCGLSAVSAGLFKINQAYSFIVFAMVIFSVFSSNIGTMSDALAVEYGSVKGLGYGKIRLSGSFGNIFISAVIGYLIIKFGSGSVVWGIIASFAVAALTAFLLPPLAGGERSRGKTGTGILKELKHKRDILLLFILIFFAYSGYGFFSGFFSLYITIDLGADAALFGWCNTVIAFSEILFLVFSDRILKKFDTGSLIVISYILICVRWLGCALITSIYGLIAVNALHGISHMLFAYACLVYVNKRAYAESRTSMQSARGIVAMGAARIIASAGGGYIFEVFGGRAAFVMNFVFVAAGLFVLPFFFGKSNQASKNELFTKNENEVVNNDFAN